jgi:hemerythrin-like domain-containing protein
MRNDTATAILREQHRLILRVVDAFERALATRDALPPAEDIEAFVTFFRLFTDACHHGKEEDVLFTALEADGLTGALDAMREEHRFGRAIVASMAAALPAVRAGEAASVAAFREYAGAYIDFIRVHIAREDDGVFEMADNRIAGHACVALCDAYETVCRGRFEGRSIDELEGMGDGLIARYGG